VREGEPFIASFIARCRAARDVAVDALRACRRVEVARPEGAFYAFFRVDGVGDSLAFAKELLSHAKVGLAPGSAFGPMGEVICGFVSPATRPKLPRRSSGSGHCSTDPAPRYCARYQRRKP
jgi:aspartate/methionine/tyrosine aminotransferase